MDPIVLAARSDAPADLVLLGGSVATMDAVRRWAQAVAIREGRVVAVGRDAEVRRSVGPRTRVVDLAGRTLLPGFQDAHVHPAMAAIELQRCTLHEVGQTEEACLAAVRAPGRGATPADRLTRPPRGNRRAPPRAAEPPGRAR